MCKGWQERWHLEWIPSAIPRDEHTIRTFYAHLWLHYGGLETGSAAHKSCVKDKDFGCTDIWTDTGWGGGRLIGQVEIGKQGHGFIILYLTGYLCLKCSLFWKGPFPSYMCEHTFKDEMLLKVQPRLNVPGGFQRKEAGGGEKSWKEREREEKTLLSLIWTVYPSPKMIQISHYWIMQKQLSYLRSLLCFLNLFSAQPNELSELSDSSKEWQMSMICCCCCYFARNTWCM